MTQQTSASAFEPTFLDEARRYREQGGYRAELVDYLHRCGVEAGEAEQFADRCDLELGLAGQPRPHDINPSVAHQLDTHWELVASTAQVPEPAEAAPARSAVAIAREASLRHATGTAETVQATTLAQALGDPVPTTVEALLATGTPSAPVEAHTVEAHTVEAHTVEAHTAQVASTTTTAVPMEVTTAIESVAAAPPAAVVAAIPEVPTVASPVPAAPTPVPAAPMAAVPVDQAPVAAAAVTFPLEAALDQAVAPASAPVSAAPITPVAPAPGPAPHPIAAPASVDGHEHEHRAAGNSLSLADAMANSAEPGVGSPDSTTPEAPTTPAKPTSAPSSGGADDWQETTEFGYAIAQSWDEDDPNVAINEAATMARQGKTQEQIIDYLQSCHVSEDEAKYVAQMTGARSVPRAKLNDDGTPVAAKRPKRTGRITAIVALTFVAGGIMMLLGWSAWNEGVDSARSPLSLAAVGAALAICGLWLAVRRR